MDRDGAGLAGVAARSPDRFAEWSPLTARIALALLAVLVVLAAIAPGYSPPPPAPPKIAVADRAGPAGAVLEDDNDLRLYRRIAARVAQGESYYVAAVDEQRRSHYPVRPGLTVRLPTLTLVSAGIGRAGMIALEAVLFLALVIAMWNRLGDEPGGRERRGVAVALLVAGLASGLNPKYNVLHEVWAAQLMALSFALYRPAAAPSFHPHPLPAGDGARPLMLPSPRWGLALAVAALALAVRELVLPYVLLMAVCAAWQRRWREAAAWTALIGAFGIALTGHLALVAPHVGPGDLPSDPWLAVRGLAGLLYKVNYATMLSLLPLWLAGPFVILALFGWAGWRSPLGSRGFLLVGGYGLGFMLFGRDNNFYWGLLIAPLLFMGAAFVPQALRALWRRAALGRPAGVWHHA